MKAEPNGMHGQLSKEPLATKLCCHLSRLAWSLFYNKFAEHMHWEYDTLDVVLFSWNQAVNVAVSRMSFDDDSIAIDMLSVRSHLHR